MVNDTQQIPTGYKQTDVGVIPEDWEAKRFGDVGSIKTCRRVYNHETKETGTVPFYKIGTFGEEADAYISKSLYESYKKRFPFPKKSDILISASGTIGRTVVYNGEISYFQDSNIIWIDNDEKLVSNDYLHHIIRVTKFNTEGGTIQRLYNSILSDKEFICPPKLEQSFIARALSDIDSLISKLNQLIQKKKNIKQGAMQELLTGKRRLPGFSGEWEDTTLGNVVDMRKGQLITSNTIKHGNVPVIAGGKTPAYYHNKANRLGKTITVSASGASAGYVWIHSSPIFASDCSTIEESSNYSIGFIYYWMKLMQEEIYYLQTGGAQPHIHPSDLNPMPILIPSIEEQMAVEQVLSDMDTEVDNLVNKNLKYKKLKQGMMQQLLTGKIRLI